MVRAVAVPPYEDRGAHHRLQDGHRRLVGRRLPAQGARAPLLPRVDRRAHGHRARMSGSTAERIHAATARLGDGTLGESALREHVHPLFSRVMAESRGRIYLANHSLGRPLDVLEGDVREGVGAWYARLGDAWDAWRDEMHAYRSRLAQLLGVSRADSIVPKTSAGQGMRAVLNTWDAPIR